MSLSSSQPASKEEPVTQNLCDPSDDLKLAGFLQWQSRPFSNPLFLKKLDETFFPDLWKGTGEFLRWRLIKKQKSSRRFGVIFLNVLTLKAAPEALDVGWAQRDANIV